MKKQKVPVQKMYRDDFIALPLCVRHSLTDVTLRAAITAQRCNGRTRPCLLNLSFGRRLVKCIHARAVTALHQPTALCKRFRELLILTETPLIC